MIMKTLQELIGLVILLFLGLAIRYGTAKSAVDDAAPDPTVSPVPTEDTSIRGMNVFRALEAAGFTVESSENEYTVTSGDGIVFSMTMLSDDNGILSLTLETPLCPDPEEEGTVYDALRTENRRTVGAIRTLFDAVMPVFHRSVSDSETIVKQCQKVVKSGETYAKNLSEYAVRISASSDSETTPKTVVIELIRNQK
jgi:hypothetical protein